MSTTNQLTWGRLSIERETLTADRRTVRHTIPLVRVYGYTASEQARIMTLDKLQLVQLIADAAQALRAVELAEQQRLGQDSIELLRRAEWERRQ